MIREISDEVKILADEIQKMSFRIRSIFRLNKCRLMIRIG